MSHLPKTVDSILQTLPLEKLPQTLAEATALLEQLILQDIQQEVREKKLFYHTCAHALAVKQRAQLIFATLEPFWPQALKPVDRPLPPPQRTKWLIALAAIAHDLVQDFLPQTSPNLPRKRESGVSETASINKVTRYIHILNQQLLPSQPDSEARFSDLDLRVIKAAIEATICSYDCLTHSVYQPYLYGDR
ncbi:MAG: hypothetical protein HC919_15610 [Oscillatoriales cyanobacterium SM2_2_1]|nr:hypothetical protein [Oscillatoriales cyanobacterium SM2_2_1]